MRRASFLLTTLLLLSLGACDWIPGSGTKVVARVGGFEITRQDAEYRNQVISIYYPDDKRKLGLSQLVKAYRTAEILRNNGLLITEETLDFEEKRIDQNTRMPEMLEKIKAIFGTDRSGYRKVFILPTFAERVIFFEFFLNHPEIQKPSRDYAIAQLERIKSGKETFQSLAKKAGRSPMPFILTADKPADPMLKNDFAKQASSDSSKANPEARAKAMEALHRQGVAESQAWIKEVVGTLKPGEVFPKVIDNQENWVITRYVGKKIVTGPQPETQYRLESIGFPKANYAEWLKIEEGRVPVAILDPELAKAFPSAN